MERCQDSSCGFENRLEYCTERPRNSTGYVGYVLRAVDELLYENIRTDDESFGLDIDQGGHTMRRALCIEDGEELSMLAIKHRSDKKLHCESYVLTTGWMLQGDGVQDVPFVVQYSVETYASGNVQAEVERPDFATGGRTATLPTQYDYEQLHSLLDIFVQSQRETHAHDQMV